MDTDDAARSAHLAFVRRLAPPDRVRIAVEMSEAARRISIDGERRRHPELTREEAQEAVLRRMWGPGVPVRLER